jgi:hypothetical protein
LNEIVEVGPRPGQHAHLAIEHLQKLDRRNVRGLLPALLQQSVDSDRFVPYRYRHAVIS